MQFSGLHSQSVILRLRAGKRQLSWLSSVFSGGGRRNAKPVAPAAPHQSPEAICLGEQHLQDPYSWIPDYKQSQGYIAEEQAHFERAAQHMSPLHKQLLSELRQHVTSQQADDLPEAAGPFWYHTAFTPQGTQTVSRTSPHSPQHQQLVVCDELIQQDLQQLQHHTGAAPTGGDLTDVKLSQDHQLVAYGLACGSEQQACVVRDLQTGSVVVDFFLPAATSFEWSADGSAVYYTTADHTGRPCKVYCRQRGVKALASDVLLFHEPDVKHFITLTRTKDWRYVLINSTSKLSSEVHLIDTHQANPGPVCVQPRQPGLEYFVEHSSGHLLILSNHTSCPQNQQQPLQQDCLEVQSVHEHQNQQQEEQALAADGSPDYSLFTLPVSALKPGRGPKHWLLLRPEVPGSAITDMDVFEGVVVLHTLNRSHPQLSVLHVGEGKQGALTVTQQHEVQLPEWALWLRPGINSDYASTTFRLYASSPAQPEVGLQLDLPTGTLSPLQDCSQHTPLQHQQHTPQQHHQQPPPQQQHVQGRRLQGALGPGAVAERLWATAPDGTAVPLTLLRKAGPQGQPRPLLVEVYGAYGHVLEADYKPHRMPLLDRGWGVALAHVRGGGELGRRWHAAGRALQKHHSVSDLLAVLQHLMRLGVTAPGLVAGHAASAGGLTLAAAINQRPEWFSAAVLEAPYIDWVAGTGAVTEAGRCLVGEHVLTEHETDEWGDPWRDPAVAELVCRLCPYTNLRAGVRYPAVMLTAGLDDSRVPWWMPVKYAAKLRSLQATPHSSSSTADQGEGHSLHGAGSGAAEVLLQFDASGSHFSMGLSGGNLQDAALQQAFLIAHTPC